MEVPEIKYLRNSDEYISKYWNAINPFSHLFS